MLLALEDPLTWLQLWYDKELAAELEEDNTRPEWKKRGESDTDARDRLKKEREEAKARLEGLSDEVQREDI